jgi:hypothetical protein
MEYPDSKFTRPIRLGMLLMFMAAFFLIAPGVILYSAGYRYDFQNGLLKETGSLSIDVLPKTATAYLDGVKIDQDMPIRLNNITPHKYTLQLSAPGYYDWEKQIEVYKNQTTYIKEMILLKKSKPQILTKDQASKFALSYSGRYLAYTVAGKNETSIFIEDDQTGNPTLAQVLPISENPDLKWAPNSNYLAVGYTGKLKVINPGQPIKVEDALANISGPVNKFMWGKDAEPQLYLSNKNGIYSYQPRTQQSNFITQNSYLDWYLDDGLLWSLRFNTTTQRLEIVQDSLGFKNVFASLQPSESITTSTLLSFKIVSVFGKTVVLEDAVDGNYILMRQNETYVVPGNHFLLSKFGNWLLTWTPWELWSYTEGDRPFLLNRSGTELNDVQSLDQYNTLALQWNDEITALYPYFYIERTLVDRPVKAMIADPDSRVLYYSISSGIWKLTY